MCCGFDLRELHWPEERQRVLLEVGAVLRPGCVAEPLGGAALVGVDPRPVVVTEADIGLGAVLTAPHVGGGGGLDRLCLAERAGGAFALRSGLVAETTMYRLPRLKMPGTLVRSSLRATGPLEEACMGAHTSCAAPPEVAASRGHLLSGPA